MLAKAQLVSRISDLIKQRRLKGLVMWGAGGSRAVLEGARFCR